MESPFRKLSHLGKVAPIIPLLVAGLMIWSRQGADLLKWPAMERFYISSVVRTFEDSYLFRMRDTHLGCLTLRYRPADIVFIGDSHSYAGYDYPLLQARLSPSTVGNCALSGMFPENVIHFLTAARGAGILPKQLIFGISPEMFWDDEDRRRDKTARAYRELTRLNDPKENLVSLFTMRFKTLPDFRNVEELRDRREQFDQQIATLSDERIQTFFQHYKGGVHALDYWADAVKKGRPNAQSILVIDRICAAAKRNQVRFGVVYIPESRWLVSQFSPEQRAAFRDVMAKFSCADWVDFSFFDALGGPDAWFVNRYVIDGYPYAAWNEPDAAVTWQQQAPDVRKWQFFDPDHMNPKGAHAFSEYLLYRISQ